jgi:hypothetical protein
MWSAGRRIVLLCLATITLAGCGWPDAYSSMPESMRLPKPEPRAADPEPVIAPLLQGNSYSVFAESSHPRNVLFAAPRRDPESLGWIFCIKADVDAVDGSPMGTQTYLVHVEQGTIGRRHPAEPGDGCDMESYHRLARAVVISTPPQQGSKQGRNERAEKPPASSAQ